MSFAPVKQRHMSCDSKGHREMFGEASIKKKSPPPSEGKPAKNIHTKSQSLLSVADWYGFGLKKAKL